MVGKRKSDNLFIEITKIREEKDIVYSNNYERRIGK
jgi:hypothetical protein